MAMYPVPTDISEKEKIVGGLFTAGQLISLLVGVGIGLGSGFGLMALTGSTIPLALCAILGIVGGGLFALLKIKGLSLMKYLKLKKKHKSKVKLLPNHKKEVDDFELSYLAIDRIIK